jgi:hypothetical protein
VQEDLISVKLIVKLQEDIETMMRVNRNECNRKCINNNKSDKIPIWLEEPKDVMKIDLIQVIFHQNKFQS